MWKDILKNIQISGQKGKTKDIRLPPKEDDDEDCFKYFYDLIKLMHPDFELQKNNYDELQPEDYWCRVKETRWDINTLPVEGNIGHICEIGNGVIEPGYSELELFIHNLEDGELAIVVQIPEIPDNNYIQYFAIRGSPSIEGMTEYEGLVENYRWVSLERAEEIKRKVLAHVRSL